MAMANKQPKNFVKNDIYMSQQKKCIVLSGPNMGGKSTIMRQLALVCVLAQVGGFVPCRTATLPVVDKLFTRIGA